ncbi:MAG: F0F1 ATP synthase subunit A [Kiritimatiellia bacterium]
MGQAFQAILEEKIQEIANVMDHLMRHEVWRFGPVEISSTVRNTWVIMALLFLLVYLATRRISERPRGAQTLLEIILEFYYSLIDGGLGKKGRVYLPIVGTLFTFIIFMNLSWFIPGMIPPTTDIMTTAALAITTIFLVQVVAVMQKGFIGYLHHFGEPIILLLPMNIIEELVKPFSLTIRLFCNMFAEKMATSILFILVPLLLPVPIMALGVLMGSIQAFIFSMLAVTYLATATHGH